MNAYLNANVSELLWNQRPGPVAQLMAVTHFVHRSTMERLADSGSYRKLSLNYEGFISLLAERDYAPGELARKLGISKQVCSKTIRELENLRLVERRKNPEDSRSSLLTLSEGGMQLLADGLAITAQIQQHFAESLGEQRLEQFIDSLERLCRGLCIEIPRYRALEGLADELPSINLLLPKLSSYCYQALIDALEARGFTGLKPNFSQVLGLVGEDGGRIQAIAAMVGVSKQAIAALAVELETLGYLCREPDPEDGRQVILRLSPRGRELLKEGSAGVAALEVHLGEILGRDRFAHLEQALAILYFDTIDHYAPPGAERIRELTGQLLHELGVDGARTLAQQLLAVTRGNS